MGAAGWWLDTMQQEKQMRLLSREKPSCPRRIPSLTCAMVKSTKLVGMAREGNFPLLRAKRKRF
jgi:hypothetical protein